MVLLQSKTLCVPYQQLWILMYVQTNNGNSVIFQHSFSKGHAESMPRWKKALAFTNKIIKFSIHWLKAFPFLVWMLEMLIFPCQPPLTNFLDCIVREKAMYRVLSTLEILSWSTCYIDTYIYTHPSLKQIFTPTFLRWIYIFYNSKHKTNRIYLVSEYQRK